jgi:serpin B
LPDAGTLDAFEPSLTRERLEAILARLAPGEISISLPRFEIDASLQLADHLSKMGMGIAFSDEADFSGIDARHPLSINAVVHSAHVSVHEAGTEAAAATAVGMRFYSLRVTPLIHLDHPFLFLIRDSATGTILFVGRVEDPSAR